MLLVQLLGYSSDVESHLARGQLVILTRDESYLREGVFDPDGMIALLQAERDQALAEGYSALRVSGEMTPPVGGTGLAQLIEYEAKLNEFFPGNQCLAMCQYDRRRFAPALLLDVLRTHPIVVVGMELYDNFYYSPPSELLGDDLPATELRHWVQNLAERKQMEEALRDSDGRYRAIFEQTKDAIVVIDSKTTELIEFNTIAHENLGYSREEFGRLKISDLDVTESFEDVLEHAEKTVKEGTYRFDTKMRTRGGEVRDYQVDARAVTIRGEDFIQSIWYDFTDRKRIEEVLRRMLDQTIRGRRILLALSQAAQSVQRARTADEVYRAIGDGLTNVGFQTCILTLTDDRTHLAVSHLTYEQALLKKAAKLTGISPQEYRFPLRPGGFFEGVISVGESTFAEDVVEHVAEALPRSARPLAARLIGLLEMETSIVAPLVIGDEAIGLMTVTGNDLVEDDVPAVTAFANQASIALENAQLLDALRTRGRDLERLSALLTNAREDERKRCRFRLKFDPVFRLKSDPPRDSG